MPYALPKACLVCGKPAAEGSYCDEHKQQNPGAQARVDHDRWRAKQAYRHLYNTAAWKRLRLVILRRDPLCKLCKDQERPRPSGVADHIHDHKGDPRLFYDPNNLRGVCKPCHDERTGNEHGFQSAKPGSGIDWDAPFSVTP